MNRKKYLTLLLITVITAGRISLAAIINIPADYPSVQQGIDSSADGDTVLAQPDTYFEHINFNGRDITLASLFLTTGDTSYISSTVIDGENTGTVVTFSSGESASALLTGFTIQYGRADTGAGIHCNYGASPVISHNLIRFNMAEDSSGGAGGGIYCGNGSNPWITNNVITENESSIWFGGGGGGIFCHNNANPAIEFNSIILNEAGDGGGIYCFHAHPLIKGNEILDNNVEDYPIGEGGGIYCDYSNPSIVNNVIRGNTALGGYGGGLCLWNSSPSIRNNTVSGNWAQIYGGGFFIRYSTVTIINSIVWNNSAIVDNEIFSMNSTTVVTYSDVLGGWSGDGNINIYPIFRDSLNGDFHLEAVQCGDQNDSPCIDAGHPDSLDSDTDCLRGLGQPRADMGAYGGGGQASQPPGCQYVIGDANNSGGYNGLDVTFGVNYFKNGPPPPYECECVPGDTWYVAGDVNASCSYNGLDITYGVAYFKGSIGECNPCADCPPE